MKHCSSNEKTTICIVRHGETNWNTEGRLQGREDVEMNENGRNQAREIASFLKDQKWDVVVSSPLKRAYETGQIIASALKIDKVNVVTDLQERSYGSASGMLPDERHKVFPDGIPDLEQFEDLRMRAMDAITAIAEFYAGSRVVVVSHGGLINSILYSISNGEFGSFKTRLANGCINLISYYDGEWSVDYYNKTVAQLSQL